MKVVSVPCTYLKNCKRLITTEKYFIVLTGRSVLVLTKTFELIKKIDGFKYVYNGKVSPDGTKLLLISNGAEFYMLSLETLDLLWKNRVKEGKYCNLEGKGIWTLDGNAFLLIVFDQKNIKYRIRYYNASDSMKYHDENALSEAHRIHEIISIPSLNAYVLLVQDLLDMQFNLASRPLKIIYYKEKLCKEYILSSQRGLPLGMDYQEHMNKLVIYTHDNTFSCDLTGDNIQEITIENKVRKNFNNPFAIYSMIRIKQIAMSKNGKYVYVASNMGFDMYDKKNGEVLYSKEYGLGVENFTEVAEDTFVLCKYDGTASLFEIQK